MDLGKGKGKGSKQNLQQSMQSNNNDIPLKQKHIRKITNQKKYDEHKSKSHSPDKDIKSPDVTSSKKVPQKQMHIPRPQKDINISHFIESKVMTNNTPQVLKET